MAFTVADERCSILLFFLGGVVGSRRNLIFWNQQTTKTLSVFAREKRNAQQAPIAAERSALLSLFFAEKEASLEFQSGVFSLSPFEGGVNRSKVFPSFLFFFLSRCFYLNPIVKKTLNIFLSLLFPP